jgi:exodeoxyribonuclease VII large subunit
MSVAEVVAKVRDHLQAVFRMPILVQGEASTVRRPRGGNLYFTLRDRRAQIKVVVFAAHVAALPAPVEEGAQVVVHGQVTAYLDAGELQLIADRVEPVGLSERARKLESLKARLKAEGLFDPARKRPLPRFPRTIGLVTSPTGAAIRDVLTTIERRFPNVRVVVSPVRVSGDAAAPEVALALALLDRAVACDVIIVARGGGSREELEPFDDERVVRAIAATRAPVVAGIGHETDVSLADFAADVRAPTPTAAAELTVPDLAALERELGTRGERLAASLRSRVEVARRRLEACARSFGFRAPRESVARKRARLEEIEVRLEAGARRPRAAAARDPGRRREPRLALAAQGARARLQPHDARGLGGDRPRRGGARAGRRARDAARAGQGEVARRLDRDRGGAGVTDKPGFEEKLRELEEILKRLERGELTLDESVAEYERGIQALRACRDVLAGAERRIEELVRVRDPKNPDEPRVEVRPFGT